MPKPNTTAPSKSSVFSPGPVTTDRIDPALSGLPLGCPQSSHWVRAQPGALKPVESLLKPAVPTKPASGTPPLAAAWPARCHQSDWELCVCCQSLAYLRAQENPGREPDRHQWAQGDVQHEQLSKGDIPGHTESNPSQASQARKSLSF